MYRQPVRAAYSVCPDSHDYTKKGRDALTKLPYCLQVHHKYLVFVTKYRLNNRFGSCIRR